MADYQCFPIWGSFDGVEGNINPTVLTITDELKNLLSDWQAEYDATLNMQNPVQSGFGSEEAAIAFEKQGLLIWRLLSLQMGETYIVSYFSELKSEELSDLSDY